MTEQEWRRCKRRDRLILGVADRVSERRLRLFACACCRRIFHLLGEGGNAWVPDLAERQADGTLTEAELEPAADAALAVAHWDRNANLPNEELLRNLTAEAPVHALLVFDCNMPGWWPGPYKLTDAIAAASCAAGAVAYDACVRSGASQASARARVVQEETAQRALFEDVVGNPFRPLVLDPSLRTAQVISLAEAAYAERTSPTGNLDPARLVVLSDALEEVGCGDDAVLSHLRGPGPHVRGCWALDLILNKS